MKKGLKILLGILIPIIILIIVYIILMINGVVPNLFLDTSDLHCFRDGVQYETYKKNKYIVFSFDSFAKIKEGIEEEHLIYTSLELAKKEYEEFQILFEDYSNEMLKLDQETIIISTQFEISLNDKSNTRKQLLKRYEEFGYECK